MGKITKMQYEYALERIEDLLPVTGPDCDPQSKEAVELSLMAEIVIEYEKEHFPIEKASPAELITAAVEEKNMTQKELATRIGVSPSRISDYINGRAEPSLRIAGLLCQTLNIAPAAMMGL